MILDKEEIDSRLSSPLNLLNRLKRITSVENRVISIPKSVEDRETEISSSRFQQSDIPELPPSVDELVDNLSDKLATAKCHNGAKEVLASAIEGLKLRVFEVDDPVKLSRIATDMGKIVNGFDESKRSAPSTTIPIIYRPIMLNESSFQIIQVNE